MEKRYGPNVGEHQHLSLTAMVSYPFPLLRGTVLHEQPEGLGGRGRKSAMTSPSCWY